MEPLEKQALEHPQPPDNPHYVALYGRWRLDRHTPVDGAMVLAQSVSGINIITTAGKEALASLLYSGTVTATTNTFRYLACGTGTGAEAVGNTALGTEVARVSGIVSYVSGAIFQVKATYTTGVAVGAITEYGLLNSSSAGTLFCRDVESVINVGASDTLTATLQVTLS